VVNLPRHALTLLLRLIYFDLSMRRQLFNELPTQTALPRYQAGILSQPEESQEKKPRPCAERRKARQNIRARIPESYDPVAARRGFSKLGISSLFTLIVVISLSLFFQNKFKKP